MCTVLCGVWSDSLRVYLLQVLSSVLTLMPWTALRLGLPLARAPPKTGLGSWCSDSPTSCTRLCLSGLPFGC